MPKRTESIYQFNHIDKNLSHETIDEIRSLYKYYHKKHWGYLKAFKFFKRLNIITNVTSIALVISGGIAASLTLNPVVLGTVSGSGLLLKTYCEMKNYAEKIEKCKFAYTSYEKMLIELRSFLRGSPFDSELFVNNARIIDDLVTDLCPDVSKYDKSYDRKFTT